MKTIHYIVILLIASLSLASCKKDTMKDVDDGKWNHEKNIVDITFENQVGMTSIQRTGEDAVVKFKYNLNATGSKQVPIKTIVPSFGAKINIKAGEKLDFDNPTNSASVTVVGADGKSLEWTIIMTPFIETMEGVWKITNQKVYGGTGPQYGGSGIKSLEDPVADAFDLITGPIAEMDNTIEFKLLGFTEQGNSYGEIINNAGVDGKYADYIFNDKVRPITDVNKFYRAIPKTGGTWERDYAQNAVIITTADGKKEKVAFTDPGYEWKDWLNKFTVTFPTPTVMVDLTQKSSDDWNVGMYTLWNMVAQRPYFYWIVLQKQ